MSSKRLFIIDGAGYYYRAYYGVKGNLSAPDGTPTNAVYGFATMFRKIMREEKPSHAVIALDSKERTFRHNLYAEYKANRQKMPEDLQAQIPLIERLIEANNIPALKMPGYEADDLIARAALYGRDHGCDVTIVSGDKDFMQMVGGKITMFDPMRGKKVDVEAVKEKFGVGPERVADVLALMGDASDNIPGVPGVGEKTAQALIREYGSLENLLKHADKIGKPKLRQSLIDNAETARLSLKLATLHTDLPVPIDLDAWRVVPPDSARLSALYRELGFKTLAEETSGDPPALSVPAPARAEYKTVFTEDGLRQVARALKAAGAFGVDTETTSTEPVDAELVGISLSCAPGEAWYVPLAHDYAGVPAQVDKDAAIGILRPLLEDPALEKYGQNMKYDMIVLAREGVALGPCSFDTMVASYLLSPEDRRHNLGHLAEKYLGVKMLDYADVAGKGAKEVTFARVSVERATEYSGADADVSFRLAGLLKKELEGRGLWKLYQTLELPLVPVLARMEQNGILLDGARLKDYSARLEKQLAAIEADVHKAAGEEFNIASPKQLSAVLFDKLGLARQRKTKTGSSTDQKVLEVLAMEHPLPALVLRHRTLSKLKSTYVDPLPDMVSPRTGRIHTSFNQAAAATGRLSSSDPNLQNIPVRAEEGREIRRAFIAPKGCVLVSADYSQIELRILAHLSGDPLLTESFKKGEDVHTRTAREIFGALGGQNPAMRRAAKAVNFGIIYGQTAFGLSQELGIPRREAQEYIDNYFSRYRGVKEFIDATIARARGERAVSTMFGRKRGLPDIASANRAVREMAERMAVNTVVQGTAADIIKMAMLAIDARLAGTKSKMLLQVHDELIFECPAGEAEETSAMVRREMASAAKLDVPLDVVIGQARNWGDMH